MLKGGKTLVVDEFTTPSSVVVQAQESIDKASALLEQHGFRHLPVVDSSLRPVGVISDRDLRVVCNFEHLESLKVKDLMSPDPFVVDSNTPLEQVVFELSQKKIGSALVTYADDNSIGIFTSTDALNALIELLRGEIEMGVESAP